MALGQTHRPWIAVIFAALALGSVATACGGDDATETDATETDESETGESEIEADATDPASAEVDGGSESSEVGDFPIPFPEGVLLDALADAGVPMDSQRQLYYPTDDFDRLVDFYDDWTGENGNWARTEAEGTVAFQDIGGDSLQMITITPQQDPGAQLDGPVTFLLLVTDQ